ncbi:hypothetical protein NXX77_00245 [Phocaeicola dorei]|nr:hypothetical protein [Phocaeicola dorei]
MARATPVGIYQRRVKLHQVVVHRITQVGRIRAGNEDLYRYKSVM